MKIQRLDWSEHGMCECSYGDWCASDDVRKLEESHQRLLDALNFILENDLGNYKTAEEFGGYVLDEDIRAFAQDAISKAEVRK